MTPSKNWFAATPGYSRADDIASAAIHGVGAVAALVACVLLINKGFGVLSGWQLAGVALYGASLIVLFSASTLYHAVLDPPLKDRLKRIDHGAIFVVIAGTYTPFMSITLQSQMATALLAIVWSLAVAGVVLKIFHVHRFRWLSLATYLTMGWLALFVFWELWQALPRPGFWLLLGGGGCFTLGTVFYAMKSVRYTHAIWHLWVVAGAACHAVAVGIYVIPDA